MYNKSRKLMERMVDCLKIHNMHTECMREKYNSTLHKNLQSFFYCAAYVCTD